MYIFINTLYKIFQVKILNFVKASYPNSSLCIHNMFPVENIIEILDGIFEKE